MKNELKRFGKRVVCGIVAGAMLLSCAFAATYSIDSFEKGKAGYKSGSWNADHTAIVYTPITLNRTLPSGTTEKISPLSLAPVETSNGAATSDLPETLVSYKIPKVETETVDLIGVADTTGNTSYVNLKADTETGFTVEKNVTNTSPTEGAVAGTAVVAKTNADGSLKLVTDENGVVLSDEKQDRGVVTASATWGNYMFVAMSFGKTYNADYYTNLVVYETMNMSKPVAEWNLRDLGLGPIDAYEVYEGDVYSKVFNSNSGANLAKEPYKNLNIAYQPQIGGIYVTDGNIYLAMREPLTSYQVGGGSKGRPGVFSLVQYANPLSGTETGGEDVTLGAIKANIKTSEFKNTNKNAGTSQLTSDNINAYVQTIRMKEIGNKLVIVNEAKNAYLYGDIENGVLTKVTKIGDNNDDNSFRKIYAEGLDDQGHISVTDVDFEGTSMYVTLVNGEENGEEKDENDGCTKRINNTYIVKLDISKPEAPVREYVFTHRDYVSNGGNVGYTNKPELVINGSKGYLAARGISNSTNGNWIAVLDMSNRDEEISLIARYNILPVFGTHSIGNQYIDIAVVDDYLFMPSGTYTSRSRKLGILGFTEGGTNVEIMDAMTMGTEISGQYSYEVVGAENYGGDIYTFYADPESRGLDGGGTLSGAIFSKIDLWKLTKRYVSEVNDVVVENNDIVLSGQIIKQPIFDGTSIVSKLNIDINGEVTELPASKIGVDGKWSYTVDGDTLEPGVKNVVKIYPTFEEVDWSDELYEETGDGLIVVETVADEYYDYIEFSVGEVPFRITGTSFNAETKDVTVEYQYDGDDAEGRLIAALYKDGALEGVTYSAEDVALTTGINDSIVVTAPADWNSIAGSTVKLFVWQHNTIIPLTNAAEYKN